jgi:hypothetical protein
MQTRRSHLKKQPTPILVLLLMFVGSLGFCEDALTVYKSAAKPDNTFNVHGDSTLHQFTIDVSQYSIQLDAPSLKTKEDLQSSLTSNSLQLHVLVSVKGLESGKKKMNKIMWDALQAKQFKEITFSSQNSVHQEMPGNQSSVTFNGDLTISGQTRPISLVTTIEVTPTLKIQGSFDLKMTDFGIPPPTAMMGMMKTKDPIQVEFEWNL